MYIYLVRHGETDWNIQKRLQGQEDIPLNERGKLQAEEVGKAFRDVPVHQVISSPLERALHTAHCIAAEKKKEPVMVEPLLIERDFGQLAGKTLEEAGGYWDVPEEKGMEPFPMLQKRGDGVIRRYLQDYHGEKEGLVFVSHGAMINALLHLYTGGKMGPGKTILENASVCILEERKGRLEVLKVNLSPAMLAAQ